MSDDDADRLWAALRDRLRIDLLLEHSEATALAQRAARWDTRLTAIKKMAEQAARDERAGPTR